jgi:integrase
MASITKRVVEALRPQARDYFVWDDDLAGFGVRVLPSGRKAYVVQYRAGGRTRRNAFSHVGKMTPDEARKHARELLVEVDKGKDPVAEIVAQRRAPNVSALCDRFLDDHVAFRCKPSTRGEYRRSVELFIKPRLGTFKVGDVKRSDIAELHHQLRHIPYQANRTLGVLSKMFNLAEVWGLRPDGSNPCRHVKKYPEIKRERYLTGEELGRLGAVLDQAERDGSQPKPVIAAIRLLMLTGARLGEVQTLKWAYVRDGYLALPDSKTGAKRIELGEEAVAVLSRITRQPDNPYVIAGTLPSQHWTDLQRPWRRIRKKAGLPDLRIHDLRHTFASVAASAGESLPMIGKLLGHTQAQTTARYAHLAPAPVRDTADRVASQIAVAMGFEAARPQAANSNVPQASAAAE